MALFQKKERHISRKIEMDERLIVFEEILPIHKWIIRKHLARKQEIYFIRLSMNLENKKWVTDLIAKGCLKEINFALRLHIFDGLYYDMAFDSMDAFFKCFEENRIIKEIIRLYKNNKITSLFKKVLNKRLARVYYLNYRLHQIQNRYPEKIIIFIPGFAKRIFYKTDGCEIYDYLKFYKQAKLTGGRWLDTSRVEFPIWAVVLSYVNASKRKLIIFLHIVGFLSWLCLMLARSFMRRRGRIKAFYRYAIMVISPLRQFANKIQKVDFLIDGEAIKKEEVIFLSCKKLEKKNKDYMEDNNLNYLDDVDSFISVKEIKKILPVYLPLLISFLKRDSLVSDTALKAIYFYLRWQSLARNIGIRNLITHADFGIQSIARNIIFEQHAMKTYYYMDTTNFGFYYAKKDLKNKYRDILFGLLYYDYLIVWSDRVSEHFKESRCHIKNYINSGCFWSEHLRLLEEGKIASDSKNRLYKAGYQKDMKLISIFDSVCQDNFIITPDDGIKFLEGILRLLDDLPNIFTVLKEKLPRNFHEKITYRFRDIVKLYNQLEKHPRCYCMDSCENSSEAMAFSDLTISSPFNSPTTEALSARKKAIWYDATNKYRDTFYDSIPGLVCHNYNELLERAGQLLNITDRDYNSYLETHIKGKIENYLDGKAMTRFRKILVSGKNINSREKEVDQKKFYVGDF